MTRNAEQTYNGWTNYATWRVNLEIFDGYDSDGVSESPESLEQYADDIVIGGLREGLATDYARAFLNDVNWQEIADHINEACEPADPEA